MAERAQFSGRMPTGGPRSALMVAVLLVMFVALAIAKPWEAPRPTPRPSAGPSTALVSPSGTASSAPSPGTTLTAPTATPDPLAPFTLAPPRADAAAWRAIRWRALAPSEPLSLVSRVIRWPGGSLALGEAADGSGALWVSSDGATWDPVPPGRADTLWPGLSVVGTAAVGSTLWVVAAETQADTAGGGLPIGLWRTLDGRSWDAVPIAGLRSPPDNISRILFAAHGSTLLLAWTRAGVAPGPGRTEVWSSENGGGWRLMPTGSLPTGFEVYGLGTAPDGALLAAGRVVTTTGVATAALLRSEDGRTWTRIALPRTSAMPSSANPSVAWSFLLARRGIVAIGASAGDPESELWWRSADGRTWAAMPDFGPIGAQPCGEGCGAFPAGQIAADGSRMVAARSDGTSIWTSLDASRWTPAQMLGAPPVGIGQLVLLPGGILAKSGDGAWVGEAVGAG